MVVLSKTFSPSFNARTSKDYTLQQPFDVQVSVGAGDYFRTVFNLAALPWADFQTATETEEFGIFTDSGSSLTTKLCDPIDGQPGSFSRQAHTYMSLRVFFLARRILLRRTHVVQFHIQSTREKKCFSHRSTPIYYYLPS